MPHSSSTLPLNVFSMTLLRLWTSCPKQHCWLNINFHLERSTRLKTHLPWVSLEYMDILFIFYPWCKYATEQKSSWINPPLTCLEHCCNKMALALCTKRILLLFSIDSSWLLIFHPTLCVYSSCFPSLDSHLSHPRTDNYLADAIEAQHCTQLSVQFKPFQFPYAWVGSLFFILFSFVFVKFLINSGFRFPSMTSIKFIED